MPRGSSAASGKAAPTAKVLVPAVVPSVKGRTKLGEGAVWSDGRLLWLDIIKGKIFTTNADSTTAHCDTRQMVGTVVPVAGTQTRVVAATHRGICVVELSTGRIERYLGNPESEQPENTWNGEPGRTTHPSVCGLRATRATTLHARARQTASATRPAGCGSARRTYTATSRQARSGASTAAPRGPGTWRVWACRMGWCGRATAKRSTTSTRPPVPSTPSTTT